MKVTFYQFSKANNSTARPTGAGTDYNCVLKKNCGTMAPRIELDLGLSSSPSGYNYAYIESFARYYFISEWVFEDRLWVAYLEEDTLATWKNYIGNESFYILRSANKYDNAIIDDMYPTLPEPYVSVSQATERPWLPNLSGGYYVVGMINNSSSAMGAVGYYVFNNNEFRTFCSRLMSNTSWLDVPTQISQGGIDDGLLRTLFNPFQYVVSCKWFPFQPPTGTALSNLPYGWWNLNNVSCSRLASGGTYVKEVKFNKIDHPQTSTRGTYLNNGPFSEMMLSFYPFGDIVLDPSWFIHDSYVDTITTVDCIAGNAIMDIGRPAAQGMEYPANIRKTVQADFGVNIQIAQIAVDKLQQAETVITGAAGVTRDVLSTAAQATNISNLLNPVSGELSAAASGAQTVSTATHAIADGIRSSVPQMQTSGMNGTLAAFGEIPVLRQTFYDLVGSEDLANTGRPYCRVDTPANVNGYMVCRNAHVTFPGTVNELAAVTAYLESGFYYE